MNPSIVAISKGCCILHVANLRVLLEAKHDLESSLIDDLCIVVDYPTSGGKTVPIEEWENLEILSN